jgi:preprotein translocase subunit SecA/nephrocystin-3
VYHTATADSYNSVGVLYANKGDYDKALELFLKALEIREVTLGVNHPDTAGSYHNVGNLYGVKGDSGKALEYYMKALGIYEKVLGQNHPKTAYLQNSIAWSYHLSGKYDKAFPHAENAVKAIPNNVSYIDTLATIYKGLGRYAEAL